MISDMEYDSKIRLPSQLKKLDFKCRQCGFEFYYFKELLRIVGKAKELLCPKCKHKEIFL